MLQSDQLTLHPAEQAQQALVSHIMIEALTPSGDGGRYRARRVAGEPCVVADGILRIESHL